MRAESNVKKYSDTGPDTESVCLKKSFAMYDRMFFTGTE